ncbi:MAG: TIM barrel protein [Planctomycetales bacterium]|nr:TIM barrel protein [Planctomycetales bacterium]
MAASFCPSVCIDAVLGDLSLADATKIVQDAGISAFEFWGWWDKDIDQILAAKESRGLEISACCTKFISLVDPAKRAEYLNGLKESIEAAKQLGCNTLISQVGDFRDGVERSEQHASLVDGLKEAASMLVDADVMLVIEPLNDQVDHAGYYLVRSDEAFQIIDEVGCSHVKVVYDIYHQQISEGNLIANITKNIDRIGHFHAAGNPGRNELTIGEINYPQVFDAIKNTEYSGYVGLEYWPKNDALAGLREVAGWFA